MDIPSLIIIAYFFLTLLVSFLCRRRNTELQRLLVAPQQLGLVLTVPLIFSGLFGGSTITGTVASAFAGGVSSAWYLLGTAVGCLLFLLLVFRFYRAVAVVKHSGSIPDAFAYRFDERTRVLMVLVIVITNSIALSTIPLSTAAIISKITGLSSDAAGWLCCIVLIVMALLSGLKGVAAMNMIHTLGWSLCWYPAFAPPGALRDCPLPCRKAILASAPGASGLSPPCFWVRFSPL